MTQKLFCSGTVQRYVPPHHESGVHDEITGKATENAGKVTGDDELKREGQADQIADQVKDKIDKAADNAKDLLHRGK